MTIKIFFFYNMTPILDFLDYFGLKRFSLVFPVEKIQFYNEINLMAKYELVQQAENL